MIFSYFEKLAGVWSQTKTAAAQGNPSRHYVTVIAQDLSWPH